ncbi:MAG TPA: class I adenylate-forming enzyme family protein [Gaiellaceae bacterium]|nr:class I adenylate-forming enzyme family protein [Gaiellaceae bacterium]
MERMAALSPINAQGVRRTSVGSSFALWKAFHERTNDLGDLAAVVTSTEKLSFGDLWEEADRLASFFAEAGVAEGTVAGLALANSPRFPAAFLALCRLDATVALLSPQYGSAELSAIVAGVRPSCIVAEAGVAAAVAAAVPNARFSSSGGFEVLLPDDPGGEASTAALLKFSSGSTAEPKGIALSSANVLAEVENVTRTLALGPGDRVLAGVPLFHSYGFDLGVLPTLSAGTTLVLEDAFVPRRTLAALAGSALAAFLGVPAQYRALLAARSDPQPDLSAVRWLLSCTAPLAPDVVTEFADRFRAPICQHYGSSETGAVTNHVPAEVLRRPESVGRAMAGVRAFVVDADGAEVPAGEEGEVVVESGAVAGGYVLGAPPGPSPFRAGSFWTGDVGHMDADGFLTVLGRRDALINVGGLKVSPAEVGATLERHPAVREAAVVGVPDGRGDELPYAVVALSEPADESELLAFCRDALAEYKVPRRVEIRDELPRTAAGKVRLTAEDLQA